jgi:tetratricopeptide (TPR) repeat protein
VLRLIIVAVIAYFGSRACAPAPELLTADEVTRVDSVLSSASRAAVDRFGYPIDTIDRREILRLLAAAHFDTLEAVLAERWDSTRADIKHEGRLLHVYDSFVQGDATIETQLLRWTNERPRSGEARVAMAAYQHGRALQARGGRVAALAGEERLSSAQEHAQTGIDAATEALTLVPDHLMAYVLGIDLLKLSGAPDPARGRAMLEAAMAAHPASFQLRWTILGMLEPRWGGSFDLMRQFAATAEPYVPQNPKLRAIAGAVPQAEAFAQRDDYGMALALLDQASYYGEHYLLSLAYGDLHERHGKNVDALAAYQRALAVSPQGRSALDERAKILVKLGALIEDAAQRDRVWIEAESSLKLLQALKPPYADPAHWRERLAAARAYCAAEAAPCLSGI